jgi:antagonist of KipI
MSVTALKPGLLTTVQDRGRRGYAALGVGAAGPMDDVAFRLANALVGNGDDAAALELTLVGPRLRFDTAATIALTGAGFAAQIDGRSIGGWRAIEISAGAVLDCGSTRRGARGYLAVAGGFTVDRILGSASTDVNAGIGPFGGRAFCAGDLLSARDATTSNGPPSPLSRGERGFTWSLDPRPWFDPDPHHPIRLIRGSHFAALDRASREALFAAQFRIAAASNRVGFRLDGPRLAFAEPLELVSEPVGFGTVQLPAGGQPIALMAEHPTTGGYPRIGQIAAIDLPRLAQRRPGDPVRFVEIDLDDAQTRYLARERELVRLLDAIAMRLAT